MIKSGWKKRMGKMAAFVAAFSLLMTSTVFAAVDWQENQADFAVYATSFENVYDVSFLRGENYESYYDYNTSQGIYLLFVNGGIVPGVKVLVEEKSGRVFVPAEIFVSTLGAEVSVSAEKKYRIQKNEKTIEISYQKGTAEYMGDTLYVPLRETIEALGGQVGYIGDYLRDICGREEQYPWPPVRILTVEFQMADQEILSSTEGMERIKELSCEKHQAIQKYLQETNRTFDAENPDYDPEKIIDTGKRMGRFYIYQLEGFEDLPIFMNQYTGEIYSMNPGLSFVSLGKGFPNLTWLYQ